MTPLRVLIADDELLARRRLARLLAVEPEVVIAGECVSGDEVLARIAEDDVDLVLLDIQMPGLDGLSAVRRWPADGPLIAFCTAHAEHAIAAFDAGAVDYLLKPVEADRLRKALDRARAHHARARFLDEAARHRAEAAPLAAPHKPLARLALPTRQGILLVDPDDVTHALLDGELVTVYTRAGGALFCDLSLQELADRLPADRFERVHRRALLNLAHVERLQPVETGGFVARTAGGHAVEVSRQAARNLRRRLGIR